LKVVRGLLLVLIRGYQLVVAPWLSPCCRYYPSCSAYTYEAIHEHGTWRGVRYGCLRLLRCHPWGGAGFDPVPTSADLFQIHQ